MRFLTVTPVFAETDFYRRLSAEIAELGHEVCQVVLSDRAADASRRAGFAAYSLPHLMSELGPLDLDADVARIESQYATPSLRDVYITDRPATRGRSESECVERMVRQFKAMELVFDEVQPEFVIPDMARASMIMVAHLVGVGRGAAVLWLNHSIFPRRMRVNVNAYHAPAVAPDEVRELGAAEREEIESFISSFTDRAKPVLEYRTGRVTTAKLRTFAEQVVAGLCLERENEYSTLRGNLVNPTRVRLRGALARRLYDPPGPERPFVYFPIHYATDFKIERVIPHCADQEYLIRHVAAALPQGYDLVIKEHPFSIGRNPGSMLRRLTRIQNVRLVDPFTSSHELMKAAAAITVISSTVGIEALMYGKPVLTMGQPYYAGYGVTVDIDSFREIRDAVPAVLGFRPDRELVLQFLHACLRATHEGSPIWVDASDENAARVASSLNAVARNHAGVEATAAA